MARAAPGELNPVQALVRGTDISGRIRGIPDRIRGISDRIRGLL
jgi:hypothetical protein